jgi:hypoxanthine phosphoribosyltransferase
MTKNFLPYRTFRNNAIKLAYQIYKSGFVPDVIYVSLRGGAYLGNVISEYFKFIRRQDKPVYYAAVVAHSYADVKIQQRIKVEGWTYDPEYLRQGDRVLLVDDIFDTGRTINHLVDIILEKGIPRKDIRIAVHDYKIRQYTGTALPLQPDYFCRKYVVEKEEDEFWIHYCSHELVGLTREERETMYYAEDEGLREAMEFLFQSDGRSDNRDDGRGEGAAEHEEPGEKRTARSK